MFVRNVKMLLIFLIWAGKYDRIMKKGGYMRTASKKGSIVVTLFLIFFIGGVKYALAGMPLVSEIYYDAFTGRDYYDEWIELYNPSDRVIDLSGWTLRDNAATFILSGTVRPLSYFIVARDPQAFYGSYGFEPDLSGSTLRLSNSGDFVILSSLQVEIDAVGYEGGSTRDGGRFDDWERYADDGMSISRRGAIDTNSADDWRSNTGPTPGSGSGGTMPEPLTLTTLLLGLAGIRLIKR